MTNGQPIIDRYAEACKTAASDQGLDPIVAALTAAGIEHEVAQTGGWCMVIYVPLTKGQIGIVASDYQAGKACVGYSSPEAMQGEADDVILAENVSLDLMVETLRGFLAAGTIEDVVGRNIIGYEDLPMMMWDREWMVGERYRDRTGRVWRVTGHMPSGKGRVLPTVISES